MANTFSSGVYTEDWEEQLQMTLDEPKFWNQVCRVDFTNTKILHNPYQDKSTSSSYTRGSSYTFDDISLTDETVNINNDDVVAEFIDEADLAQLQYDMQMERAERQAQKAQLIVENEFVNDYGNMTTFDDGDIGGTATNAIALTNTNVDDVIRNIKRKIYANDGHEQFSRNGGFVIWDPEAYEKLEAYAMSNGFNVQDNALEGGANGVRGFSLMGMDHYVSNSLTTATSTLHCVAGVKKMYHLGILDETWGRLKVLDQDPNLQAGIGLRTRVVRKGVVWNNLKPLLFDVQIDRS